MVHVRSVRICDLAARVGPWQKLRSDPQTRFHAASQPDLPQQSRPTAVLRRNSQAPPRIWPPRQGRQEKHVALRPPSSSQRPQARQLRLDGRGRSSVRRLPWIDIVSTARMSDPSGCRDNEGRAPGPAIGRCHKPPAVPAGRPRPPESGNSNGVNLWKPRWQQALVRAYRLRRESVVF